MSRTSRGVFYSLLLCLVIGHGLLSAVALAQGSPATHRDKSGTESVKDDLKFEVVSIRPIAGQRGIREQRTPDGFTAELSLSLLIRLCYTPDGFGEWFVSDEAIRISNLPNLGDNIYAINARVADADLEAWRNQGMRQELVKAALRDVLKDRFKLVIRQQPIEVAGWQLVTKGKGLKLKETPPGLVLPSGGPLVSGGVNVNEGRYRRHYYGASMEDLAAFLSLTTGRPVKDSTGLTGRYEFVIQQIDHPSQDADDRVDNWPIDQLGLALKPGKVPGLTLIIDHIEKPTEN